MKYFMFIILILSSSCGNPHLTKSSRELTASNPPAEAGSDCSPMQFSGLEYYFGEASAADYPTEFLNSLQCREKITEDFNRYSDGPTMLLTNEDQEEITFEIRHYTGPINQTSDISQYFGTTTYQMELQNPVTQYGASGTDRGVNSMSLDNTALDTLVWKFSEGISFFAVRVVSFKKNSTMRLFNCNGDLIDERLVNYPNDQPGYGFVHHLGFTNETPNICYVAMTGVHNDAPVAIDDALYGR